MFGRGNARLWVVGCIEQTKASLEITKVERSSTPRKQSQTHLATRANLCPLVVLKLMTWCTSIQAHHQQR
jgi:hypothetical protein